MTTDRKNRLEECTRLIEEAMKCLENGNKECAMKFIGLLIKNQCHDGRVVGREIANEVGELVHRLWLESDLVERHEVMTWLMGLNVPKTWKMRAIFKSKNPRAFNNYVKRYVTEWNPANSQVIQNANVRVRNVIAIEELLRKEFGWNERIMCMRMWRFIGINLITFNEHNIDICGWLDRLTANELTDIRWLGWFQSDLVVTDWKQYLDLLLSTTNTISAIHFAMVLRQIKVPSIYISRYKTKNNEESEEVSYYITIPRTAWPWPLNKRESFEVLRELNRADFIKILAAVTDGDGSVVYHDGTPIFQITFGKDDIYEANLLKELLWTQLGIEASIVKDDSKMALECHGDNAVQLLSEILPYMTHPLRSLRIKLILMYKSEELSQDVFHEVYDQIIYEDSNDPKRNNALAVTAYAAPQTHTHRDH
jgi:hypothetical protein